MVFMESAQLKTTPENTKNPLYQRYFLEENYLLSAFQAEFIALAISVNSS